MSNEAEPQGPTLADSMPARAAEFAEACKGKGMALDFLPRTLPLVERVLTAARTEVQQLIVGKDPNARDQFKEQAMGITAYVGEVIRRETGGAWYDFENRPLLNIGDYATDPMAIVVALFEGSKAHEGDVSVETLKAYCELICRMQRLWLDGTLIGTYESMSALRTSMTPDAKLAGWIVGQAQNAVKTAKMSWDESLDFSDSSLDPLERILSALHTRHKAEPSEERTTIESQVWGAYLGEVIRRRFGGQWSIAGDGRHQLTLSGWTSYPVDKVRKRITDGSMDNVRVYFGAIPKAMQSG
jgi:hypothetical protein